MIPLRSACRPAATRCTAVIVAIVVLGVTGDRAFAQVTAAGLQDAEGVPAGVSPRAWAVIRQELNQRFTTTAARAVTPRSPKLEAAGPSEMNRFGWSVAVSGDTVVVGAPGTSEFGAYSGAVYVFERDHTGPESWGRVARLTASDASINPLGNQFGRSVSISGDRIIVGAVGTAQRGQFTGSAYIFERDHGGPNAWGEVAKLTASDASRNSFFGEAVAIDGDTALVGAPEGAGTFPKTRRGTVYVFMRDYGGPSTWGEFQRLTAAEPFAAGFGFSVSLQGSVAIVGAPFADRADLPFGLNAGAAYVFERDRKVADTWTHAASLTSSDRRQSVLGWSVGIYGETAVAGGAAAAYVFTRRSGAASDWKELTILRPGDTDPNESIFFGGSVSVFDATIAVGAVDDDEKGGIFSRSGSAYLFQRSKGGLNKWGKVLKLTAADGRATDQFGHSVHVNGGTVIVGAPKLGAEPGAAYVCELDGLSASAGACRRAVPVVNSQVTMSDMTTSCCADSEFLITTVFTNTSKRPIWSPFFEVIELRDGWRLKNADGGPGGVGSVLTADVGDRVLSPGESVQVTFVISIPSHERFWFRVNLRGDEGPDS